MASRSGMASRLTLGLTQLAVAAALTACGGGGETPATTVVSAQPTGQTVVANGTATFTILAKGDNLKFQWQRSTDSGSNWSDVSGATNATLVISNVSTDQDGHLYRARVTGDGGTVTTSAATLRCQPVVEAPKFTVNLTSPPEITEGADVTLAITASGTNLTYRWETSPAGSSSWTTLSGKNSPLLLLNDVPLSDNGRRYRVIISNSAATITSQIATLGVKATSVTPSTPTVTAQPAAVSVKAPASATFAVNVSGSPTPTVQWQSSATNSSNPADWTDISGANDLSYRIASTSTGLNGTYYRAKVSNSAGTAYSQAAKLTVTAADVAPSISTHPANQTVTVGAQATFTVAATGTPTPAIQWQISSNGGSTWTNINGAASATYSFTTTTVGTSQYRAVASNDVGSAKNSNAATLTVNALTSKLSGRSWTKGVAVEGTGDNATVRDYKAAIDDEGRATVLFVKSNGSREVLYVSRGSPNGPGTAPTFSTPVALDDGFPVLMKTNGTTVEPIGASASPAGNAVVTWVTKAACNSGSYQTNTTKNCNYRYVRRFMAAKNTWEAPILVASTAETDLGVLNINDKGDVLIEVKGWKRNTGNPTNPWTSVTTTITYKAASAGPFTQQHIEDTVLTESQQHLDNKGNLLLVGQATQDSTKDIVAYRGTVSTGLGTQEKLDTRGAAADFRKSFVGINGQAVVMWNQQSESGAATRFSASLDDPQGSWSQPKALRVAEEISAAPSYPYYGMLTDDGDFFLYRNGWRVQRVKRTWIDYSDTWSNWDYWNSTYSNVALNRDGSALVTQVGTLSPVDNSWATFDGPNQAMLHAFPANESEAASGDFMLGVKSQMTGTTLLAKNGIGLFVSLNTFDELPSVPKPAGDKRTINHLWALYFK